MFAWLKEKLLKGFLLDWLEAQLAKLPGDGKKLVTGLVLTGILLALQYMGTNPGTVGDVLIQIKDLLLKAGNQPIIDVTELVAVIGAVHKIIKVVKALMGKAAIPAAPVVIAPK